MEKQEKKKLLLAGVRVVCFVLVFLLLLRFASVMLMPGHAKAEDGTVSYITYGYRGEPKKSIDMVAVGNSDLYRGISPIELWNRYGIVSYISGEPLQKIWKAHNILKDMFRYQSPKVVVLEVDSVYSNSNASAKKHKKPQSIGRMLNHTIQGFKSGVFNDGVGTGVGYLFPVVKYHSYWDKMDKEDYTGLEHGWHYVGKGFVMGAATRPYTHGYDYMSKSDKVEEIDSSVERKLEKILELCKKNGATVVLLELPSASSWSYEKHNGIQQFADKHGLDFYDFNVDGDKFGFDWMKDTKDAGNHLNIFGAEKASAYFGNILQNKYGLPDRRGEANYQHWKEDAALYAAKKQEKILEAHK